MGFDFKSLLGAVSPLAGSFMGGGKGGAGGMMNTILPIAAMAAIPFTGGLSAAALPAADAAGAGAAGAGAAGAGAAGAGAAGSSPAWGVGEGGTPTPAATPAANPMAGAMALGNQGSMFANMGKAQNAQDPGKAYKQGSGHVGPQSPYFAGYQRPPGTAGAGQVAMGDTMMDQANSQMAQQQNAQNQALTQKVMQMLMNTQVQKPGVPGNPAGAAVTPAQ